MQRMSQPYKSTNRGDLPDDAEQVWSQGTFVYYRRGIWDIAAALIELDPHPIDKNKRNLMDETMVALSGYSDTALMLVAEQINQRRRNRQLKHRPRLHELKNMCAAASPVSADLDAELAAIFNSSSA